MVRVHAFYGCVLKVLNYTFMKKIHKATMIEYTSKVQKCLVITINKEDKFDEKYMVNT